MAERLAVEPGSRTEWRRIFTLDDVRKFSEISGDRGVHHVEPDAEGRLMVQGLLTATLPTKLGGDLNYLAREMRFEFLRPVFTGEEIVCVSLATRAERQPGRTYAEFAVSCANPAGKEVLRATVSGVILDSAE
jgi:3-hydroxybutyryl-CoA dehydratase